jgi:ankyrin repeat protein
MFLNDLNVPNIDETIKEMRSKARFVMLPKMLLSRPWWWAVMNGFEHLSKHLLTSVTEDEIKDLGGDALQIPSERGYEKVVQILIDAGADINAHRGFYGNALQAASFGGHERIVQMLIDAGADVNFREKGPYCTSLQAASERGHEKIVRILVDAGADVNAQGSYFGNALQAALEGGYENIVQMLIDAGAVDQSN